MKAVPGAAAWRARVHVVLAAIVLVAADAPKPLVVDDTAYVAFARQIVAHPFDPYGFEIFWGQAPQPAFEVLAPPLLPYWLAGSMTLLGDQPAFWKLALLPFTLALTASLWWLLRRFAPGLEAPLVWMAALSPSVLPFLNLMLDVPAAALALLALALFLAACERPSLVQAALAGLVAGLAMQTKYTGATVVAGMLAYGALNARLRHALVAAGVAAAVFWGWEALMALRYGQSHLVQGVLHLWPQRRGASPLAAFVWALGFLMLAGAVAPAVGVLGLAALGGSRRAVAGASLAVAAVFGAIALLPGAAIPDPELWPRMRGASPEGLLFGGLGCATAASVARVAVRLARRERDAAALFLVAWLVIEVAGFAVLSPYLAARRTLGAVLASLVLCGRAAVASLGAERARRAVRVPLALGATLGGLFAAADFADAVAVRDAVRRASSRIVGPAAQSTVWYLGHWGFQFYAERAGMRPVVEGRSRLRRGDWLVVPEGVSRPSIRAPGASPRPRRIEVRSVSPWSTNPWAYMGPIAIAPRSKAQVRVSIHRVLADFVPPREQDARPEPRRRRAARVRRRALSPSRRARSTRRARPAPPPGPTPRSR